MRKLTVAIVLIAAAALVSAEDIQSVKKAINLREQQFVTAMKTKDAAWFDKTATADFSETDRGKKYSRAESMAQMQQMVGAIKSVEKCTSTITSIKLVGKNAVVVTTTDFAATLILPNNKTGKLVSHSIQQETWVPVGKEWKIKEIRGIKEKDTLNGKPIPGM